MKENDQHKILDYYFGTINGLENPKEIKQKLAQLTWELKEELELIEERTNLIEDLKEKKKVAKYIDSCNSRIELLDLISKVAEEEKQKIISEVSRHSIEIGNLEKDSNVALYREHQAKLAYLNTRLEQYLGREFENLKDYYRPIYIVNHVEKTSDEKNSKYELSFYAHDVFSRKKLFYTTKETELTNLKRIFSVREYQNGEAKRLGDGKFYISEKMDFKVKPELWFQYPSKEFENQEGDFIVKKYLYPKK